jgi:amidase
VSVTTATDLWRMSATELAEAIRSRQASSREVVEAHLRRIEAVNPAVNAVTVVLGEQALQAAKAADRVVAGGDELPRLHGVPFTVKENIDVAGTPTTLGLKALAAAYPRQDAPSIERLKAAGAIPIGRTNLATFTVRWHCDSELYGATMNPWDRSRTPGALTGSRRRRRAAQATPATDAAPAGLGTDGSARQPSPLDDVDGENVDTGPDRRVAPAAYGYAPDILIGR